MSHLPQIVSAVFSAFGIAFIVWLFWRSFKRSSDRPRLMIKWIFTGLVLWFVFARIVPDFQAIGPGMIYGLFVMVVVGIALAATWRHSLIDILANPLGSLYDGGNIEVDPKPYYSVALSKRKLNKPLEAIVEVREQLDKFPNDYEGVLSAGWHSGGGPEGFAVGGNDGESFLRLGRSAAATGRRRADPTGRLAFENRRMTWIPRA